MGIPIIGGIVELGKTIGNIFSLWQQRKTVEAEGKVKVAVAKTEGEVKRVQTVTEGNLDYDQRAVEGMRYSWKDEYWSILWGAILVSCFLPWTQPYLKDGFMFMNAHTPWWFEYTLVGMIVASFGLKSWNFWKNGKDT